MNDELGFDVPGELEAGIYADRLIAWFTRHQLVLDFAASISGDRMIATARVRVPASATFEVLRSLTECIGRYELEFGETHEPRRRGEGWTDGSG